MQTTQGKWFLPYVMSADYFVDDGEVSQQDSWIEN
jgi:hypothetical protein